MKRAIPMLILIAAAAPAADAAFEAKIAPAEIALGESADLTITATGDDVARIAAPQVPGLKFTAVSQSRRVESVNGVTTSSFSLTYQVTAEQPGTYVIAGIAQGVQPVVLKVDTSASPAAAPAADAVQSTADGTAFVRLIVPQHELYVGQSVPVEIRVGTHDGVVASLNGLPALAGDAFTLDKLSPEPEQRTEEVIDGKPFTVFTWHSVLAAIKPGSLALRLETPLTVRLPVPHPSARFLDDSTLEDVFNDPAFQGFFGGSTEKDIIVSSPPMDFTVLELPPDGRPKDFSGAVGQFSVSSELPSRSVVAGDPVTLSLTVSGEGSFDRVNSSMLGDVEHWKTYRPTARFTPGGGTAFRGNKTFEQPIVATDPGVHTLPGLAFSYFDPVNRRYETARTEPLTVQVLAAPAGLSAAATAGQSMAATHPEDTLAVSGGGLRPDHVPGVGAAGPLIPPYYRPAFLALPAAMIVAFPAAWFWLGRRGGRKLPRQTGRPKKPAGLLADMDRAATAGNVEEFLVAARALLQKVLSARWHIAHDAVTLAELDARLGVDSEIRRLFALADEARYAGPHLGKLDLAVWRRVVLRQMQRETASTA